MFVVGSSIGIAIIDGTAPAEVVMACADSACYDAKMRGRNRIEVYTPQTCYALAWIADSRSPETILSVIVHNADRLHPGVHNDRADELESSALQGL
jgi:hypothetical protein